MTSIKEVHIVVRWQPAYWTTAIGAGMVLAGFVLLLLGWRGTAALLLVPLQLPYAVSGGLAGLALVGSGVALLNLQVTRHLAARERARTEQVIREATNLLAASQSAGSTHRPSPRQTDPMPPGSLGRNGETPIRHASAGSRLIAALLGAMLVVALPLPARASSEAEAGTSVEAWFRGNLTTEDHPLCVLPCPVVAAPEAPYPDNTLHVGVSGGSETARTYFSLDLSGLPSGATVTGGSVRLPVAGADAGTMTPELAGLVACAVDSFVPPTQGGPPSSAPPVDCSRTAALELDEEGLAFTLDLAPLTTADPAFGDFRVAVMPSGQAVEEAQTWRVAFHGRNRDTDDAEPITARILYRVGSDSGAPGPDDSGFEPNVTTEPQTDDAEGTDSSGGWQAPTPTFNDPPPPTSAGEGDKGDVQPPIVAPNEPQSSAPSEPMLVTAVAGGPAYPQVWLLPLVFLALGGLLARSLSLDYAVDLNSSRRDRE